MTAYTLRRQRTQELDTVQEAQSEAESLDIPWEFFV